MKTLAANPVRSGLAIVAIAITSLIPVARAETGLKKSSAESLESSSIHGVVRVSSRFINLMVQREVTRQQYLQEYVLGTLTSGPVVLRGTVTAELVPYPNNAGLDIRLLGTTECLNHVGERGPVTISSSATGQIDVRKRVVIGDKGLQVQPAMANCTAHVQIHDIFAQNRIIERIAWRRAKRMYAEIQQAAAETAGTRTEQQLDAELNAPLAEADEMLTEKFGSAWSKKVEEFPLRFALSSTKRMLQAALTAADGATVVPVKSHRSDWDVFVGLHESCFDRLFQATLAGKTVDDATILDVMQIATGNAPRPLWVHDRTERWSVVLAKDKPVTGEFANDLCSFTVRFEQIRRGDEQLDRPLEVTAQYKLEITRDGPHLIRQSELDIRFSDASVSPHQELESKDESFRKFVQSKMNGFFQAEIYFDGLVPPAGGSLGKLRELELRELSSRDGWFSIGYQLSSQAADHHQIAQTDQ